MVINKMTRELQQNEPSPGLGVLHTLTLIILQIEKNKTKQKEAQIFCSRYIVSDRYIISRIRIQTNLTPKLP